MSDLIPVIAVISLCANAVLMIAYAALYKRASENDSRALWYELQCREMARLDRNSVRRDPKTGRYLKNRSN